MSHEPSSRSAWADETRVVALSDDETDFDEFDGGDPEELDDDFDEDLDDDLDDGDWDEYDDDDDDEWGEYEDLEELEDDRAVRRHHDSDWD